MNDALSKRIIDELSTALYRWYPFISGESLLYIGNADPVSIMLRDWKGLKVVVDKADHFLSKRRDDTYRYIVIANDILETIEHPEELFVACRNSLLLNGTFLFGIRNRLGIRYFAGDHDPYTKKSMDGIENYWRVPIRRGNDFVGRCYDSAQIEEKISESGLQKVNRYSVYPGIENPTLLVREDYKPNETVSSRVFPQYDHPYSVFLDEQRIYDGLLANGMFHHMANGYLFECVNAEDELECCDISDAFQISNSLDRGVKKALITVIHSNGTVTKEAAFQEGEARIHELADNMEYLKKRGVPTVEGRLVDNKYVMPFIDAPTGEQHLKKLLVSDLTKYLYELNRFRDIIYQSSDVYEDFFVPSASEEIKGSENEYGMACDMVEWKRSVKLLKKAFFDMVPLNCFYIDNTYKFFDQEISFNAFPIDCIMYRVIQVSHDSGPVHEGIISKNELFRIYDLLNDDTKEGNNLNRVSLLNELVMKKLRNEQYLDTYYRTVRTDNSILTRNRDRMNLRSLEYKELFEEYMAISEEVKLILFGSGKYAQQFLTYYGGNHHVHMVLDNNQSQWGKILYPTGYENVDNLFLSKGYREKKGVRIASPDYLYQLDRGEYRVIICIKHYESVIVQLDEMGINDYTVYEPERSYRIERKHNEKKEGTCKMYHLGYTAGAFDMFHTGHVNLLRRSKEMCDYLIVGVMSDEAIRNFKKKEPVIPYEDRAAVVASCRYVDEVVEIPYMAGNSDTAWNLYHFDVQFCGTDYIGNEGRMKEKEFLEAHGAELVMFPYTEHTSSSKIRDKLKERG